MAHLDACDYYTFQKPLLALKWPYFGDSGNPLGTIIPSPTLQSMGLEDVAH